MRVYAGVYEDPAADRRRGKTELAFQGAQYPWGVANVVIRMMLEEFERGLVLPPTADDVSLTVDGRRLDI